jgi:hypothetical protein
MAIYRLHITGLKVLDTDADGWPVTEVVNDLYTDIEEDKRLRLQNQKAACFRAKEQFPDLYDLVVDRIERIDKSTGKDVPLSYDGHPKPTYKLNSEQLQFLEKLKNDILNKIIRDSKRKKNNNLPTPHELFIEFISEDIARLVRLRETLGFDEIKNIISAIETFYSRITPLEIKVLNLEKSNPLQGKSEFTHDEIMIIRLYKSEITSTNESTEKRTVFFNTSSSPIGILEFSEDNEEILNAFLAFLQANKRTGFDWLPKLLNWAIQSEDTPQFIERIGKVDIEKLQKLNASIEISSLKSVLSVWENNRNNPAEEFWQAYLSKNSFVFSQIFSIPIIVLKDKAYVGGKGIENIGGGILDYLYTNKITKNVVFIEIKTPQTKLLGSEYRHSVYSISNEISGAIIQVANYRDSLTKEYYALVGKSKHNFEAFNPPCMVIAGNIEEELIDSDKRKSFELFRNGLKNVEIISFDELFTKVKLLIDLLEGNTLD